MKKVLILLISLVCAQNISGVALRRINSAQVGIFQNELFKEIRNNKNISYSVSGAMALAAAYLAYKHLTNVPKLIDTESTINEMCRLYKEGKITVTPGFMSWGSFKSVLPTLIAAPILEVIFKGPIGKLQSKLFKNFDVTFIIQEKTKIALLFSALKNNFAALDNRSKMFDVKLPISVILQTSSEDGAENGNTELQYSIENNLRNFLKNNLEIYQLKTISTANSDISEADILNKIREVEILFKALVLDLERVLAFMQYKQECYQSENRTQESNIVKGLIEELENLVAYDFLKFDTKLTALQTSKAITQDNGLLPLVFEFQRKFLEIISRLP